MAPYTDDQYIHRSGVVTMNRVSTGAGLCALAAAVAGFPIINQLVGQQQAAQASPVLASAVSAAVMAQAEPTIVWYGVSSGGHGNTSFTGVVFRAWSNGLIEYRQFVPHFSVSWPWQFCEYPIAPADCDWKVFSDPAKGLAVKADITDDKVVDAQDLSYLLAAWGDAPPVGIPPSDCPLNLINP